MVGAVLGLAARAEVGPGGVLYSSQHPCPDTREVTMVDWDFRLGELLSEGADGTASISCSVILVARVTTLSRYLTRLSTSTRALLVFVHSIRSLYTISQDSKRWSFCSKK